MAKSAVEVYESLRTKIGEDSAKILIEFVENTTTRNVATREDLKKLEENMATKEDIKKLEEKMVTKEDLKFYATKEDLANLRAELLKWMFIFWIGQVGVLTGILTAILYGFLNGFLK